jgi:hypothetical protein
MKPATPIIITLPHRVAARGPWLAGRPELGETPGCPG